MRRWPAILFKLAVPVCMITLGPEGCDSSPIERGGREAALGARPSALATFPMQAAAEELATPKTHPAIGSEPWDFAGVRGQRISTPGYRLHTTIQQADMLALLPVFMEAALAHYTSALGPLPPPREPLESYLLGTRREWEAKTREILPDQASTYLSLGRGGFTTRGVAVLYDIDDYGGSDTLAITAHEGWHQYTQRMFRDSLPVWLEEGIATYMEGFQAREGEPPVFLPWKNRERFSALRYGVRRDRLIPLRELVRRTPQTFITESTDDLLLYYAQVWALTHFLVEGEGGRYAMALRSLVQDALAGRIDDRLRTTLTLQTARHRRQAQFTRTGDWAIREFFNSDLAEIEAQYDAFIRAITANPQARELIRSGKSPLPRE